MRQQGAKILCKEQILCLKQFLKNQTNVRGSNQSWPSLDVYHFFSSTEHIKSASGLYLCKKYSSLSQLSFTRSSLFHAADVIDPKQLYLLQCLKVYVVGKNMDLGNLTWRIKAFGFLTIMKFKLI